MTLPADCSPSSSPSSSTSPPSDLSHSVSSATTNLCPQEGASEKSLKRKRSSSTHRSSPSGHPSSCLGSIEVLIKSEEQEQEGGLCRKQKQEHELGQEQDRHTEQSSKSLCTSPAVLNDVYTTPIPRASPVLLSNFSPEQQAPIAISSHYKDQGTQTHLELPLTETYLNWSGRGRSPFKTPVIAAIDGLKQGAKWVEKLERQLIQEQIELEKVIQLRATSVHAAWRFRYEISLNRMDPLQPPVVLAPPPLDEFSGKSRSPERYLDKMRISVPPIRDGKLESYQKAVPEHVKDLLQMLKHDLGKGCIPSKYKAEIAKKEPQSFLVPADAFSTMDSRSETAISMLWKKADEIVINGLYCQRKNADENTWGKRVVEKFLGWETCGTEREPPSCAFSQVEMIQSQLLAKSCRQKFEGKTFETKKTDWALSFNPQHPEVEIQYDALALDGKAPRLSQMNNDATSKVILYSATEVKVPGGSRPEAQSQLFSWFQAGISRMRQLMTINGTSDLGLTLPLVGWTAVGADWQLFVAFGEGNGEEDPIAILGPIDQLQCEMLTYHGTFRLLQLMERFRDWARNTYWPWYCKRIVEPLKLTMNQSATEVEASEEEDE